MMNQIEHTLIKKYIAFSDNILTAAPECFQIDVDKGEISGMITNWIHWCRIEKLLTGRYEKIKTTFLLEIRKINRIVEKKSLIKMEKVLGYTYITFRYGALKALII